MLELNELFRVGRRALAIGVAILSGCVIVGQTAVASLAPNPLGRVVQESLMILGWVANWKPIEIFFTIGGRSPVVVTSTSGLQGRK